MLKCTILDRLEILTTLLVNVGAQCIKSITLEIIGPDDISATKSIFSRYRYINIAGKGNVLE